MYLCSPAVHVEATQLPLTSQTGVFAVVTWRIGTGGHVETRMRRQTLLVVGLVGLGDAGDRDL